jgi:hypothetical protein
VNTQHATREQWLLAAKDQIKTLLFDPLEMHLPPVIRVSVGLCGNKKLGLCVDSDCMEDGSVSIFVDPSTDDTVVLIATLVHELVHASVGVDEKHGPVFKKAVRELGLQGKATATYAEKGTELYTTIEGIAAGLGTYPHAKLVRKEKDKKSAHPWISFLSPSCETFIVRCNKNTVREMGPPRDFNGEPMVPKDPTQMEDTDESAEEES